MSNVIPFPLVPRFRLINDERTINAVQDWLEVANGDSRVSAGSFRLAFALISQAVDENRVYRHWPTVADVHREFGGPFGLDIAEIKARIDELRFAGFVAETAECRIIPAVEGEQLFDDFPKALRGGHA